MRWLPSFTNHILLFSIIGLLGFQVFLWVGQGKKESLQAYADRIVATCSSVGFAPACYDEEIPKLMDRGVSMEEAFAVTRVIQEKDPRYLYCHVLAHKVSAKETSKNLAAWKDVVTRCPTTFCNNGCQHGALMRRFNAESLTDAQIKEVTPDLLDVCEPRGKWKPTEIERSMCYHALGHLHMYITNATIPKAVALCETVGKKSDGRNYVQTCTEGVFMTVYQPLEPEDIALVQSIAPQKETVDAFCRPYTGESWEACHRESWPLFGDEIKTPAGLVQFCSYSRDTLAQEKCYGTVMNSVTLSLVVEKGDTLGDLTAFCTGLPADRQGWCFADAARRLMQIDPRYQEKSLETCRIAEGVGAGKACYETLADFGVQSFHQGSEELRRYCKQFPDTWQSRCLTAHP